MLPEKENTSASDFYPYTDNGGSVAAIGGDGFVVIASDTRLSAGYGIYTRDQPKLFILPNGSILGSTGCWCDILALTKLLEARIKVEQKNMEIAPLTSMTPEKAVTLIKDAFISAAERETHTGDGILICTISKTGIIKEQFALRRD